jgi:hypothetical protein
MLILEMHVIGTAAINNPVIFMAMYIMSYTGTTRVT